MINIILKEKIQSLKDVRTAILTDKEIIHHQMPHKDLIGYTRSVTLIDEQILSLEKSIKENVF